VGQAHGIEKRRNEENEGNENRKTNFLSVIFVAFGASFFDPRPAPQL
jgi:hypothetical protein